MKFRLTVFSLMGFLPSTTLAQNAFRNLSFEEGQFDSVDRFNYVPTAEALGPWRAYINGREQKAVYYNYIGVTVPSVTVDARKPKRPDGGSHILSLAFNSESHTGDQLAVFQTGTIPPDAKSLHFYGNSWFGGLLQVSIAGETLFPLGVGRIESESLGYWDIWAVPVEKYAGRTVTLGLIVDQGRADYDGLSFSSEPAPERSREPPKIINLDPQTPSLINASVFLPNGRIVRVEISEDMKSWRTANRLNGTGRVEANYRVIFLILPDVRPKAFWRLVAE